MPFDQTRAPSEKSIFRESPQSAFTSRWPYLLALYPALSTLPYFFVTSHYSSPLRVSYVLLCSLLAAGLLFLFVSPRTRRIQEWLLRHADILFYSTVAFSGLAVIYFALAVMLQNGWGLDADVANMEQTAWAISQGSFFFSSFNNGSALSAHFAPFFVPVGLIYALFPGVRTLFVLQSLMLVGSAVPLYWLAREPLGKLTGMLLAFSFLVSPATFSQHSSLYLNHFAPLFWIAASLAFYRKRWMAFVCCSVLAASVQEDVAASLFVFALPAWIENRSRVWKAFTTLFPLLWVFLALTVIQINSSQSGVTLGAHFIELGGTPSDILQALASNPQLIVSMLLANVPSKLLWVYELLAPLLWLLPFGSLMVLAAMLDGLVFVFVPLAGPFYAVDWYYSLLIATILLVALILALGRLKRSGWGRSPWIWASIGVLILCNNLAMLPLVWSPDLFQADGAQQLRTLERVRSLIPPTACVAATDDIMQPFAQRFELYQVGFTTDSIVLGCDYIVESERKVALQYDNSPTKRIVRRLESEGAYRVVFEESEIRLWVRK